mgnify:CR=1 FL=1
MENGNRQVRLKRRPTGAPAAADFEIAEGPVPDPEAGEVLVRGANVFRGYHKQQDATREAIDAQGWFHTGDAGFIDPQGHLAIIDRAKDVGKLGAGPNDGTPFAPQFIENKLKFSPFIGEAVAKGHKRPFLAAMITEEINTLRKIADAQR